MSDDMQADDVDVSVDSAPETSAEPAVQESSPQAEAPVHQQPQASVWDAFKNLEEFRGQDEVAIARRLYASMEREKAATERLAQYQQYIPYAQQYLQNREPFERWLESQRQAPQQQQAPQQAAPPQETKKWWNPPEVRESFKQYLVKDENGREVISPDAPLDARHALYEYQKYKADFAQKFLTNPEEAIGPMIQEIAQQQAQQIVQSQFHEAQQQQYVASVENENRDWLYDQNGQPTQEGLAAQQYIEEASQMGIQDPKMRWDYATKMIERDLLERLRGMGVSDAKTSAFEAALTPFGASQQVASAPAFAPQEAQPSASTKAERDIEFLRREASRNPSKSAGIDDPRTPKAPQTFEQLLTQQLRRDNVI